MPLNRQIREGFLISVAKGTSLTRKGEWDQNLPPKLSVEWEKEEEEGSGGKRKLLPKKNDRDDREREDREKDKEEESNVEESN